MLLPGDTHDFFEADHALTRPAHAVLAQGAHAVRDYMRAQCLLGGAVMDQPAQVVVDAEQFVNAGAPAITGAVARGTSLRGIQVPIGWRETKCPQLRR